MGTSSSKTDTITVKPGLLEAESWSTLDAFVTSETGRKRRQTVAVNTYSQGEQVHQVKTTMNYPDSKQISSVALDLHLQKSKTYAAHQSDKTQAVKFSEDMKSSQGMVIFLLKLLLLSFSYSYRTTNWTIKNESRRHGKKISDEAYSEKQI